MPRLPNRGTTQRAPQTGASIPELPDFNPQLAELPGAQETNASLQRWWDLIRQRIEFNNGSVDKRMQEYTRTIGGITGSITILQEITSDVEDYLESRYTINVAAGAVVTGMTIFSATGPDVEVSEVAFQADRFKINTSSGGNKQIFSATASAVKLGDVLTVDLVNAKVFIGTGTYANANTGFYVDSAGNFSLKNKLTFDGSTLTIDGSGVFTGTITATAGTIGGWNIAATTISKNNAILDSAGQLILGTSNDIVYISATDPTYRMWVGNVTAGSATFRVSKTGVLTATGGVFSGSITSTSGTIGGWTINPTTIVATSGGNTTTLNSNGFIDLDGAFGELLLSGSTGLQFTYTAANRIIETQRAADSNPWCRFAINIDGVIEWGPGSAAMDVNLYRSAANVLRTDDAFAAASFSGDGASLTALSASNISSGTLGNARLPSAISVASLTASGEIRGATARFGTFTGTADAPVNGWIDVTDAAGNARKVATVA